MFRLRRFCVITKGVTMNSKDRRLPKAIAKRFGHRSHVRLDRFVKRLEKTGFFEWRNGLERQYLNNKDKV